MAFEEIKVEKLTPDLIGQIVSITCMGMTKTGRLKAWAIRESPKHAYPVEFWFEGASSMQVPSGASHIVIHHNPIRDLLGRSPE